MQMMREMSSTIWNWLTQDRHKQKAAELKTQVEKAFTEHPAETGENYFQHLYFTFTMSGRMLCSAGALLIHGLLPFLFVRTASSQIEKIYSIVRNRIQKNRREVISQPSDALDERRAA